MLTALAPLQRLTAAGAAVLVLHHPRKADGMPRGSGTCANGECAASPTSGGAGSPCTAAAECLSGSCTEASVCDQGDQGTYCNAPGDCLSGVCAQGSCVNAG